ncbi:MAG: hypothetical protein ACXW20_10130 [Burkholderiales bacterium]
MRQQWEFVGAVQGWSWRSTDSDTGSEIQHSQCFDTLFECLKDAELRGYSSAAGEKRVYRLASESQMA